MNINDRIKLMVKLGEYFVMNNDELQKTKQLAEYQNAWFSPGFIDLAIKNLTENFLQETLLQQWANWYELSNPSSPKKIGVVMAGNIPLVGFHDFLSVFISGHEAVIKPSSKDEVLIKHIITKLHEWDKNIAGYMHISENLKKCDAYIATGSNNSSRYFEYYFSKYPNIIRKNKTSVALLTGNETKEELNLLADDIQLYYGLGCRNVSKIYAPKGYDFIVLLDVLSRYNYFADFHKYKNNYDYQLSLLIMNHKYYMTNDSIILTENESVFAPVSQLNYTFYDDCKTLAESLKVNPDIQCIIGNGFIDFGKSQFPSLTDYADGIDTLQFLKGLT